ncbi:hypothetical protein ACHAXT_011995 [Thalassiosira profunda]
MKLSSIKVLTAALLGSSTIALAEETDERMLSHGLTYYPTAPAVPTAKPTSPCEGNTPDWEDVDGDGCEWYEMMDLPGCPRHGNLYRGARGVADDNCCYCAGTGSPVVTPQPSPYPTYPPTITRAPSTPFPTYPPHTPFPTEPVVPTAKPTSPCEGNTPNWRDSHGDDCTWFEMMDTPGCPTYGDMYVGDMGAANENCCYCAGTGAPSPALTSFPTF